jgi:hypothetical protein
MKKILLLALALCVTVVSCSRGFIFKAINNSGQNLVIVSYDGKLVPHEFPVATGSSVDVQFPTQLSIKHSKGEWKYDLVRTDKRYYYTRSGGLRVQDIQIEADGAIYLLQPKTKQAVRQFPQQPDGFPIRPK